MWYTIKLFDEYGDLYSTLYGFFKTPADIFKFIDRNYDDNYDFVVYDENNNEVLPC